MYTRHYNGPQKTSQEPKDSSQRNCSKGLCSPTGGETKDLESNSKMFSERKIHKSPFDREFLEFEMQVEEKYAVRLLYYLHLFHLYYYKLTFFRL